jgi:hypothetical protein
MSTLGGYLFTFPVLIVVYKNVQDEMKVELKEMKDKITGMERKQDRTKVCHDYWVIIYLYCPGSWLVDYNNERQ